MSDVPVAEQSERESISRQRLTGVWWIFALTRIYLLLMFLPQFSDLQVYFEYAIRGVDLHQTPYQEVSIEYPPVAYWLMSLPRLISTDAVPEDIFHEPAELGHQYSKYASRFRWMMLVVDLACFLLFLDAIRRRKSRHPASAAWSYVLATAVLGHFLYDRLDLGLSLLFMIWLYARTRSIDAEAGTGCNALSYLVLGISVSYKLIGAVALPFVFLTDFLAARREHSVMKSMSPLVLCGVAGVVGPFLLHYPTAGWSTLDFLRFHGERGIQIESLYASLLMAFSAFGHEISVQMGHGSANLVSSVSSVLATGSTIAVLCSLLMLAVWSVINSSRLDRSAGSRLAMLAILLTLLFSKVFSAQYLIFAVPLILILSAELLSMRAGVVVSVLLVLQTLLTTLVVPYCWFNVHPVTGIDNPFGLVPGLHPVTCAILIVRNMLFAIVVIWLGFRLSRCFKTE